MFKVGSLFTGIGGLDLGFGKVGFKTIWFCEKDKNCQKLLRNKFPKVPIYSDVKDLLKTGVLGNNPVPYVDVIVGGDPCPAHSKAKGGRKSVHPDLSGYYLAVVGRLAPKWVVRENVPSPVTIKHFALGLEVLGYSVVIVWANADQFVPQNRERAFVVGCVSETALKKFSEQLYHEDVGKETCALSKVANCLVARSGRSSISNNYVWQSKKGLRNFLPKEQEFFAGFPQDWTAGFSDAVRNRMCGNAVVPAVAEAIAMRIKKASQGIYAWPELNTEAGIKRVLSSKLV